MIRVIDAGKVELYFREGNENYCNACRFRRYINHEMKYWCVLFREGLERDGDNFIRLEICHMQDKGAKP